MKNNWAPEKNSEASLESVKAFILVVMDAHHLSHNQSNVLQRDVASEAKATLPLSVF